jgi:hypothetical protein
MHFCGVHHLLRTLSRVRGIGRAVIAAPLHHHVRTEYELEYFSESTLYQE